MTPIDQFILSVHQQGIKLWLDEQKQLRFKAPKGALTPALQCELKARKAEIIHFLDQADTADAFPQIISEPEARYEPFPLTDIQEAYWLGRNETFELHTATHYYEELAGQSLEPVRVEQAWQKIIQRHEMLRAIILASGEQQVLAEVPAYSIKRYDLTQADETSIEHHLETMREAMCTEPFSLTQWPLFELRLTQLPAQEVRLHLSFDMLIVDWGSYEIILRELTQAYHQPELALPDVALSFRDYVLAEKKIQQTNLYQRAEAYWKERLANLPPAPELPLAVDPSTLESVQFKRHWVFLEMDKWSLLKKQASQRGLTPTSLLLTVFSEVLTRWSKRAQFTLNLTLFNRLPLAEQDQINQIVGDFTSVTMLAVDNSNLSETLAQRSKRLQNQLWQDLEQRYFSGVQVLRALAAQQKSTGQARMPVVFTSGLGVLDQGSSWLGKSVNGFSQTPQVWLDSQIEDSEGRPKLIWDVVEALFPPHLVEAMFSSYVNLLNQLADDESLWEATSLDLLPASQQQQLQQINKTEADVSDELLHTLFIKQAIADPNQPAIIALGRTLSYGQLYQEATEVALSLRANGASPNQLVAVVMNKGWEQIVAVMGILISGAAYLPIDAELPTERQHYLLEQGEVQLVLTQPHLENQLTWPDTVQCFCVEEKASTDQQPTTLKPLQTSTDLAYVIYTSGSTGLPKGVVIDHRGAVNTILDINDRFGITSQDRVLAISAMHFDLSVYDVFGLLATGGAIVMPDPEGRRDPSHWAELMIQHKVTVWNTVPALMQMLVEYQAGSLLSVPMPLRLVMMSGDWIPLDLPERIRPLCPEATLMSLGGATEASIWSIYYPIERVDPSWNSIPYGKPMVNQTFHVLNERMEDCPTWVPGQLYIGGIGLALGYWKDEEKTQASFITHPRSGERLYKTGDLGRYLPDGNIEFLGREDFQVKIRGHRIELGEIESQLAKHSDIKEVIVSAVGESRHNQQLVAYIVPTERDDKTDNNTNAQAVDQVTDGLEDEQDILTDSVERLQFKLSQRSIRPFETTQTTITLPSADTSDTTYLSRQSYRQFLDAPMTLTQLGQLLSSLSPRDFPNGLLPKYRYASGGSLYPIQSYLYVKPNRISDLAGGFYYYHPVDHQLVLLSETVIEEELYGGTNQIVFDQSAFSLFLVAEYQAIEQMYGSNARDLCLLETGFMAQLLMMECSTYDIGLCPIGGLNFEPLRAEFGLTDSQEMLHSVLGGYIAEEQKTQLIQGDPQVESLEERLKTYLGKKLPSYMVPNIYIELPELPLTANGKINRKALPSPDLNKQSAEFVKPSNELEAQLVELVQKLFKAESISLHDDFFNLGADSLDMVQLYNEIQATFQREVKMIDIFNHTTVYKLAEFLNTAPVKETEIASPSNMIPSSDLSPEEVDQLSVNLDNLTEAEIELLLTQLDTQS